MEKFEENCDYIFNLLGKVKHGIVQIVKRNNYELYITFGTLIQNSPINDTFKKYYIVVFTKQQRLIFGEDVYIKIPRVFPLGNDATFIKYGYHRFSELSLEKQPQSITSNKGNLFFIVLTRSFAKSLISKNAYFFEVTKPTLGQVVKHFGYSSIKYGAKPILVSSKSEKITELEANQLYFIHNSVLQTCVVGGPIIELNSLKLVGIQVEIVGISSKIGGRALNIECLHLDISSNIGSQSPESCLDDNKLLAAARNVTESTKEDTSFNGSSPFHWESTLLSRQNRMVSPTSIKSGHSRTMNNMSNSNLSTIEAGSLSATILDSSEAAQPEVKTEHSSNKDINKGNPPQTGFEASNGQNLSLPKISSENWRCVRSQGFDLTALIEDKAEADSISAICPTKFPNLFVVGSYCSNTIKILEKIEMSSGHNDFKMSSIQELEKTHITQAICEVQLSADTVLNTETTTIALLECDSRERDYQMNDQSRMPGDRRIWISIFNFEIKIQANQQDIEAPRTVLNQLQCLSCFSPKQHKLASNYSMEFELTKLSQIEIDEREWHGNVGAIGQRANLNILYALDFATSIYELEMQYKNWDPALKIYRKIMLEYPCIGFTIANRNGLDLLIVSNNDNKFIIYDLNSSSESSNQVNSVPEITLTKMAIIDSYEYARDALYLPNENLLLLVGMEKRFDKYPKFDLWRIECNSSSVLKAHFVCNLVTKEEKMRLISWGVSPYNDQIIFCHFFRPEITEWIIEYSKI